MNGRIEINPNIHFGKPVVAGTRIPVLDVLELVKEGYSFENIIKDFYPVLKKEDVQACIEYAMSVAQSEDIHITG